MTTTLMKGNVTATHLAPALAALVFALVGAGCAVTVEKPDLTASIYQSRYFARKNDNPIGDISIVNKAKAGEVEREGATSFSWSRVPLVVSEETKITVEEDLRRYLEATSTNDQSSNRKVFVTILKADSYIASRLNASVIVPVVGAFTGNNHKVGLNLKVQFELEENGKIIKEYLFDRRIERNIAEMRPYPELYSALIEAYREDFFNGVDSNVVRFLVETSKQ